MINQYHNYYNPKGQEYPQPYKKKQSTDYNKVEQAIGRIILITVILVISYFYLR